LMTFRLLHGKRLRLVIALFQVAQSSESTVTISTTVGN
jgi:hypothetical protein